MRCLSYIWSNLEVYDNSQYIHSTIFLKFIHVFLCIFSGNWHRNLYRRWWIQVSFKAIFFKVWLKSYNLKNHRLQLKRLQYSRKKAIWNTDELDENIRLLNSILGCVFLVILWKMGMKKQTMTLVKVCKVSMVHIV